MMRKKCKVALMIVSLLEGRSPKQIGKTIRRTALALHSVAILSRKNAKIIGSKATAR